jgi:hypothetical protein
MTRVAILLLAAWIVPAGPASAQDPPPDERPINLPPNGTQLFRALLDFRDVKPAENPHDATRKIVVVYGKPDTVDGIRTVLTAMSVAKVSGGAVVVLTDQSWFLGEGPILAFPAIFARATAVDTPARFLNFPDCPYVVPTEQGFQIINGQLVRGSDTNPFSGLTSVATNRPGVVFRSKITPPPQAHPFATHQAQTIKSLHPPDGQLQEPPLFAVGQVSPGPGRWIAVADEDVISNSLLAAKGTDNFVLAYRLVDWLRGPEGRSECVFYEYGRLQTNFKEVVFVTLPDLPGPPVPPIPPLKVISQQLTDFGNKISDELQSNDRLHNHLVGGERGYARWLLVFSVLAAGVAFVYLVRRMIAGRQPAPGPSLWAHDDGPPGKLLAVLRQEMVRGNNFTAAVTAYIDETFRLAGLPPAGPYPETPFPVSITGRKVKKVELYQDIAALWAVWRNPPDRPIHYAVWRTLESAAEHCRRLAVKGRWHFAPDFVPPPGGAA